MSYQWRDLIGALLSNKYRLTEYLGDVDGHGVFATNAEDGAAIVRLARDETPGAEQVFQQWSAAARLPHPAIIRSYEVGKDELDGTPVLFTVTERPDDSLAEVLRGRALTADEARSVADSILDGLAYLHSHGSVHGQVAPDNIVAVKDHIKLSSWPIRQGTDAERDADVVAAGQTIIETVTQRRPADVPPVDVRSLPSPIGKIARACIERKLTASGALAMLRPSETSNETKPSTFRLPMGVLVAALAGVVLLIFGIRSYESRPTVPEKVAVVAPPQAERERAAPTAVAPAPPKTSAGNWVVVAAIYRDYDLAAKRAEQIAQKEKRWQPEVYPPEGQGGHRYMVLLGRAETRKEAERILARARSAGMPSDTYLTKLKP
jgi:Protein kinase domain/SPOR domain